MRPLLQWIQRRRKAAVADTNQFNYADKAMPKGTVPGPESSKTGSARSKTQLRQLTCKPVVTIAAITATRACTKKASRIHSRKSRQTEETFDKLGRGSLQGKWIAQSMKASKKLKPSDLGNGCHRSYRSCRAPGERSRGPKLPQLPG